MSAAAPRPRRPSHAGQSVFEGANEIRFQPQGRAENRVGGLRRCSKINLNINEMTASFSTYSDTSTLRCQLLSQMARQSKHC